MAQNKKILIDTSCWIEALRKNGDTSVREQVKKIILNDLAVSCDFVLLELWNGARGEHERRVLKEYESVIPCLPTTQEVWDRAKELAIRLRASGATIPASDLLIAASALHHEVELLHRDTHFEKILAVY